MALIKTVAHEEATGTIKEAYDIMASLAGAVPKPLQLVSASPKVFEFNFKGLQYYMEHPSLSLQLLAAIRFISATRCEYPYCIDANKNILTKLVGLSEEQAMQLLDDPQGVDWPEKDKVMLSFVKKALEAPEDVQQADVDKVRAQGWSDADIFDAVNHGAFMVYSGILFNVFKMGI